MRVVVTGGAGFIGRAVVGQLAARGDDVVALVRDPAGAGHHGPHDHSAVGRQLEAAHAGRLRSVAFGDAGLAWAHVDDLACGVVAALDRGRVGEAYSLGGECRRLREVVAIAARVGGHRPPRLTVPNAVLRAVAPVNDRLGGLPGMPANLGEAISASAGVTYWVSNAKAASELGYAPRSLAQGIADTWGGTPG